MASRGRAYRRDKLAKKKVKFKRIISSWKWYRPPTQGWVERWIVMMAACHKPCSCTGCGNPRRHGVGGSDGLTLQERKAKINAEEQILESQ